MSRSGRIPTLKQLERAGADAGAVLDAVERDLELAIARSTEENQYGLKKQLKRLHKRRDEWFGPDTE